MATVGVDGLQTVSEPDWITAECKRQNDQVSLGLTRIDGLNVYYNGTYPILVGGSSGHGGLIRYNL